MAESNFLIFSLQELHLQLIHFLHKYFILKQAYAHMNLILIFLLLLFFFFISSLIISLMFEVLQVLDLVYL